MGDPCCWLLQHDWNIQYTRCCAACHQSKLYVLARSKHDGAVMCCCEIARAVELMQTKENASNKESSGDE